MQVQAQPGITRTDVQQHDLSVGTRGRTGARRPSLPGVAAPEHSHPGEEIIHVIEGVLEYQVQGEPPVTVKASEVVFIRAEAIHAVTNVGSGYAAKLATAVAERDQPLVVPATGAP
jgi:quercetin dioxygenase-like cupin family protein